MPKVSVILTSYNKPKLVKEAIESVLNQTCKDFELIICDDNSDEKTKLAISSYLGDPRIKYIQSNIAEEYRRKKCRYAVMINRALEIAKGEYISYLCDDDIYYPKRLELMSEDLDQNPDHHIVYGKQKNKRLSGRMFGIPKGIRETVGVTWEAGGKVDHNSMMHRRSCVEKVGFWDEAPERWNNADEYFFKKLNEFWPFHPIEKVLDEHRFHSKSIQSKVAYEQTISYRLFSSVKKAVKYLFDRIKIRSKPKSP